MSAVYDLGPFCLHVEKKTLTKAGMPVALGVHAVGVRDEGAKLTEAEACRLALEG